MYKSLDFFVVVRLFLRLSILLMIMMQNVLSSSSPVIHKKILVIDDSNTDLIVKKHLAKAALEIQDDQLDTAMNAEEAINKLKVTRYNIILADGYMGGEGNNVDTLIKYIKDNNYLRLLIPIFLHSGNPEDWKKKLIPYSDLELKFFEKGANGNKSLKAELSRYK